MGGFTTFDIGDLETVKTNLNNFQKDIRMKQLDPTHVYTDKILKMTRYLVEHETIDGKRLNFTKYDNDTKIYCPSTVKRVEEFYFTIEKERVYHVFEAGKDRPIPIFNSHNIMVGDVYTIRNTWFNQGAITIGTFDLETMDMYGKSWDQLEMSVKEYSKYVFEIITPEQLPTQIKFLSHKRPDVVEFERRI